MSLKRFVSMVQRSTTLSSELTFLIDTHSIHPDVAKSVLIAQRFQRQGKVRANEFSAHAVPFPDEDFHLFFVRAPTP